VDAGKPNVGYRHDQCRHPLPSIGPLSVEGSRSPLFYWYKRTSIFELQLLEDWMNLYTCGLELTLDTSLYYNKGLHAHEFNTFSCLFSNKELCSLPDFIL